MTNRQQWVVMMALALAACSPTGSLGESGGTSHAADAANAGGDGRTGADVGTGDAAHGDSILPADPGGGGDPATGGDTMPPGDTSVQPPLGGPTGPLVERGGDYMGFVERFNRYYTDSTWTPTQIIYVSPTGTGDGASYATPTSVTNGIAAAQPGTQIFFEKGTYAGCYGLSDGGTYDAPIVLYAERNADESRGVHINCCATGRNTCINLEGANYVAIDGFELQGGNYGIRAVGQDLEASLHQVGTAMLNNHAWGQNRDPYFTGASDWVIIERNIGHDAGSGDGHGIYLSNGSDWCAVRYNELYHNYSSDFQINADPAFCCTDVGIAYDDPACDGDAAAGLGQGVSDYMLLEGNYFHDGLAQGPNFTSVRHSLVRNNVFAFYARHGFSFWQETDNPNLASADNVVHHNLFIGNNNRELLQFTNDSDRNDVRNNVLIGVTLSGESASANATTQLVNVDGTTDNNVYVDNYYIGGTLTGRSVEADEHARDDFDPTWFADFPFDKMGSVQGFVPAATAPFLDLGEALSQSQVDFNGEARTTPVELGPFEAP